MHTYVDPKDNVIKSSHLLRDCRRFLDLQKHYAALYANANTRAYPAIQAAPAANAPPQVQPQVQQPLQIQDP